MCGFHVSLSDVKAQRPIEPNVRKKITMSTDAGDVDAFWDRVRALIRQADCHYHTDNLGLAEQLNLRVEECVGVLRAMYGRFSEAIGSTPRQSAQ